MFLLDTNILSELRRRRPNPGVSGWVAVQANDSLHTAAVVLGELQDGAERTRRQDSERAAALDAWIDEIALTFNVLPMTGDVFRLWAKFIQGRSDTLRTDAMIAATASTHGFTVVTGNTRDFAPFRVPTLNPFRG